MGCSSDYGHGRGPGEGRDVVRQRVGLFAAGHRPDCHCCCKNASGSLSLQPAVLEFFLHFWSTLRCRACELDMIKQRIGCSRSVGMLYLKNKPESFSKSTV